MGVRKIFFRGGATREFSLNFSRRGKNDEFNFSLSKLGKQPLSAKKISKSRGGQGTLVPPSDAHEYMLKQVWFLFKPYVLNAIYCILGAPTSRLWGETTT